MSNPPPGMMILFFRGGGSPRSIQSHVSFGFGQVDGGILVDLGGFGWIWRLVAPLRSAVACSSLRHIELLIVPTKYVRGHHTAVFADLAIASDLGGPAP
jgi:hypothetical protein